MNSDLVTQLKALPLTQEIEATFTKTYPKIHGYDQESGVQVPFAEYNVIMVSVSGGSDSDIMLDLIERVGHPYSEVHFVFFDTGMEFQATKRHLTFLEEKYGIHIERVRAKVPVPLGVRKYGYPFLSKHVSKYIHRLQLHNFCWEDRPFEELYAEYPRCKAALRWWCNLWGENSKLNISRNKWLKEFLVENQPQIPISDACCQGAKKDTAHLVERALHPDLSVRGVRKAEGGVRSTGITSCFEAVSGGCDQFRPIFWFKKADKIAYENAFGITHSDCYVVYGLDRTGCACCPFGKYWKRELMATKLYEPKLYEAAIKVFGPAYDYTMKYLAFCEERNSALC